MTEDATRTRLETMCNLGVLRGMLAQLVSPGKKAE